MGYNHLKHSFYIHILTKWFRVRNLGLICPPGVIAEARRGQQSRGGRKRKGERSKGKEVTVKGKVLDMMSET
jgi:hypothetical protein